MYCIFLQSYIYASKMQFFVKSISRKFREIDFILEANPLFHFLFQLASLDNNIISGNWSNEKKEMFGDSFNFTIYFLLINLTKKCYKIFKKLWWYFWLCWIVDWNFVKKNPLILNVEISIKCHKILLQILLLLHFILI